MENKLEATPYTEQQKKYQDIGELNDCLNEIIIAVNSNGLDKDTCSLVISALSIITSIEELSELIAYKAMVLIALCEIDTKFENSKDFKNIISSFKRNLLTKIITMMTLFSHNFRQQVINTLVPQTSEAFNKFISSDWEE